jgi:hypothetical protein
LTAELSAQVKKQLAQLVSQIKGSDQMSGKLRTKQTAATRKRVTKRERMMTDKESSDLLESASQALAMVQGSKFIGAPMKVARRPPPQSEQSSG